MSRTEIDRLIREKRGDERSRGRAEIDRLIDEDHEKDLRRRRAEIEPKYSRRLEEIDRLKREDIRRQNLYADEQRKKDFEEIKRNRYKSPVDLSHKGPLSKEEIDRKKNKEKVIKRINEIIDNINDTNMDGRTSNYLAGGKLKDKRKKHVIRSNYAYIDPQDGLYRLSQKPDGFSLEEERYPEGKMMRLNGRQYDSFGGNLVGGGPYGNSLSYLGRTGMAGAGKRKRKPRTDKGKTRKPNEWQQLVKAVCAEYNLPYNKGLKKASELKKQGFILEDFI